MFTRKLTTKPVMLFAAVIIALLTGGWLLHASSGPTKSISQPKNPPAETVKAVNRGLPVKLIVPQLGINTLVTYLGLTKSGNMDTPKNMTDVGWYKYGPLPGNEGSAVISGHVIGQGGTPAIFKDLDKLQVGDTFSIIDTSGQSTNFMVREKRTYGQDEQPAEVFSSREGAHLNLITCAGDWDKTERRYLERLVVFSDKVT